MSKAEYERLYGELPEGADEQFPGEDVGAILTRYEDQLKDKQERED